MIMADQEQKPEPSARKKRQLERLAKVKSLTQAPRVRVVPKNDELRKVLKHPTAGMAFRESGSVEWPLDNFTKRRIRDGDVTIEEREPREQGRRHEAAPPPPPVQPPTTTS
jgi:hypothetical protein